MKMRMRTASIILAGLIVLLPIVTFAQQKEVSNADGQTLSQTAYDNMQRLADLGIVTLPAGCHDIRSSHFTREEMTDLTLQALSRMHINASGESIDDQRDYRRPGLNEVLGLRRELYKDLQNRGMIDDSSLLTDTSLSPEATELERNENRKYKISGEIRYNYVDHSGSRRDWNWRDSRLRARLYLEARLNDNWHIFGMIEGNKHFLDSWRGRNDDWLDDKRLYVRGMLTDDIAATAGRYGYMIGDGNIFDSSVRGVTLNWGDSAEYEATAGKTKAEGSLAGIKVSKKRDQAEYGASMFHFGEDDWGKTKRTIGNVWYNYHIMDNLAVGAMYIGTSAGDADGRHHGCVARAVWGSNQTWKPGSRWLEAYYYYQPEGTYVIHTMSGLADYMDGFRGVGLLYHYTLASNLVFTLEYYHLRELASGDSNHTLWADMSYYF